MSAAKKKKKVSKKVAPKKKQAVSKRRKVQKRPGHRSPEKLPGELQAHYGGYGFAGPSDWHEAVINGFMKKSDQSPLVKRSDTSVFQNSANHGRSRYPTKFTASFGPSELMWASVVYLVALYQGKMIEEILKDLFVGHTNKSLKAFVRSKKFKSFNRPLRFEYKILIPQSKATVTIVIKGATPVDFQKSVDQLEAMKSIATAWCGANSPQDGYFTFIVSDGQVTTVPKISVHPV